MSAAKISAFFWHGFALARAYKLNFVAKYLTTFVTVVFFFFLAEMFEQANVVVAPRVDYFTFLVIGGAFSKYVEIGMRTLSDTLREEMLLGTIEPLLATATPTTLALLGPSTFIVMQGSLLVTTQLAFGAIFGADFSRANWFSAFVITLLLILSLLCWGIISAAFTLRYKRSDPINFIVGSISYVFSGVFFPVAALPSAMQVISYLLPFTYALRGLRGALIEGKGLPELGAEILALVIFIIILLPLVLFALNAVTRYLKKSGALGHY